MRSVTSGTKTLILRIVLTQEGEIGFWASYPTRDKRPPIRTVEKLPQSFLIKVLTALMSPAWEEPK